MTSPNVLSLFSTYKVIKRGKHVLPTVARLCLIATFFEDGLRMYFQWNEQREYMDMSWGCGKFLATVFVLTNLFGQLGGCGMVIARFKVDIAVGLLFFIVVLQVTRLTPMIRILTKLSIFVFFRQ